MKIIIAVIAIFSVFAGAYCQYHQMTKPSLIFAGLMGTAMALVIILTKAPVEKREAPEKPKTLEKS